MLCKLFGFSAEAHHLIILVHADHGDAAGADKLAVEIFSPCCAEKQLPVFDKHHIDDADLWHTFFVRRGKGNVFDLAQYFKARLNVQCSFLLNFDFLLSFYCRSKIAASTHFFMRILTFL